MQLKGARLDFFGKLREMQFQGRCHPSCLPCPSQPAELPLHNLPLTFPSIFFNVSHLSIQRQYPASPHLSLSLTLPTTYSSNPCRTTPERAHNSARRSAFHSHWRSCRWTVFGSCDRLLRCFVASILDCLNPPQIISDKIHF